MSESSLFRESTVLVLGAGASKPFGFPLGEQLKNHIVNNTPERSEERRVGKECRL